LAKEDINESETNTSKTTIEKCKTIAKTKKLFSQPEQEYYVSIMTYYKFMVKNTEQNIIYLKTRDHLSMKRKSRALGFEFEMVLKNKNRKN